MKHPCRTVAAALVLVVACAASSVTVFAAPSKTYVVDNVAAHNQAVNDLGASLQKKYDITIQYPVYTADDERIYGIFPETLHALDAALETITPGVVRQVSDYYRQKNGQRLTYAYTYADLRGPYGFIATPQVTVGGFDDKTSRIELYIPRPGQEAVASGDNMLTAAHEFGHALHLMIADQYGYDKMAREWLSLMNGAGYGAGQISTTTFITEYASTSFDEDFAETFAYAYMCNRSGLGLYGRLVRDNTRTILGSKVAYVENLIPRYLTDTDPSMENFRKVYTTAASTSYNGIKLSGAHLMSIGMDEPRSAPLMLLNMLEVQESSLVWIKEVGGWYCKDANGQHRILFPDGAWGDPGKSVLAA